MTTGPHKARQLSSIARTGRRHFRRDLSFSFQPEKLLQLRIETERAWQSLGVVRYGTRPAEEKSTVFRRSLYISRDVKAGDVLSAENVRIIRPDFGSPPKFYDVVIGKQVGRDAAMGTPITQDLVS